MKAITLWQPWASAMALGLKHNETRSWPTAHRGPLAICAAARRITELPLATLAAVGASPLRGAKDETIKASLDRLPYGCVVCVVEVYDCVSTNDLASYFAPPRLTPAERCWGNYDFGRFAWLTRKCLRLAEPVPVRGRQGLFNLPAEVEAKVFGFVGLPALGPEEREK